MDEISEVSRIRKPWISDFSIIASWDDGDEILIFNLAGGTTLIQKKF